MSTQEPEVTLYGLEPIDGTEDVIFVTVTLKGKKLLNVERTEPMAIAMALMKLRRGGAEKWLLKR